MDALALLCNLHADGPSTLHRLRALGCDSLAVLLAKDERELTRLLEWPEHSTTRFLREGRLLFDRLEGPEDDEDAALSTDASVERAGRARPSGSPTAAKSAHPSVARVLDAWRDLDKNEPPDGPLDVLTPHPPRARDAEAALLLDAAIEGLDRELAQRLQREGITTVQGLIETDALGLAARLSLGYSRVARLQFLARRLPKAALLAATPRGPGDPRTRFDSAGPFA